MSPTTYHAPAVLLASIAAEGDERKWIQIAYEGEWRGHHQGIPFRFSRDTFTKLVANFRAHPRFNGATRLVAFDIDHASETNGPPERAKAHAWAHDLEVRTGPDGKAQLWALTEYLPKMRQSVRDGEWQGVSAAVVLDARDTVTGDSIGPLLTSVAFTNNPFLRGLPAIAATMRPQHREKHMDLIKLSAALNLPAATEDEDLILAHIEDFQAQIEQLESERAELESELGTFREREAAVEVDAVMASYKVPAQARAALLTQRAIDPDGFRSQFPSARAPMAHATVSLTQPTGGNSDPLSSMVVHGGGVRLNAQGRVPGAPPPGGAVCLTAVPGENITVKAMNYVRSQPGGAELDHDSCWEQAVQLVRSGAVYG